MTTAPLTKTHATKLTLEETARAAAGIKLLARSKGFTHYAALHSRLVQNGYPASYATFGRLMNGSRNAQRSEVELIARYFNVEPRDLTGEAVNPVKDPAPPRLIEFDVPGPVAEPEGPMEAPAPRPLPTIRGASGTSKAGAPDPGLSALADAISGLTAAVREQMEWQKTAEWHGTPDQLRKVG